MEISIEIENDWLREALVNLKNDVSFLKAIISFNKYAVLCSGQLSVESPGHVNEENQDDGRIVGGYETSIEKHPYQVSLQYRNDHICGGSIISSDWIVTAGHCVATYMNLRYLSVKAGTTSLKDPGQVAKVQIIIAHENYTRRSTDNDIALLRLEAPLELGPTVGPIELPPLDGEHERCLFFCDKATVTGWGVLESKGKPADRLRAVAVPLVSNAQCAKLYEPRPITERMLCAGHVYFGGKDACQGDSGGPLVQGNKLIGIVSWGLGCAKPYYPGVYTRVTAFRSWINDNSGV
ncbi:PREDICTED: trypsin-7-like [Ceratosolen solmsi marchali]|uniref:Trypsin-7-like n=1 Tax=Ceratosolen solmsi marchali TaxID=326594 RepID=A0AAJ6YP05_9HYME|nr:PREDICTED: trypsin-7-like [Ceratosolen solmsi marchali]